MEQTPSADNQQPSAVEIGWLAGFVDGEGCFCLNVITRKDRQRLQATPKMTVVNTSDVAVAKLHDILGRMRVGHLIKRRLHTNPAHRHQTAVEVIGYKRMARLLPLLVPHLVNKKDEASLMSAFVDYRIRNWQQENGGRRAGYDGIELEVHKALKAMHHSEGSETKRAASLLIERMI